MTVEEEQAMRERAAKEKYDDADIAALAKDVYEWLRPVYNKLPDFSKKRHAYQMTALSKIAEQFGEKTEAVEPVEPPPEEDDGE